MKSIIKIGYKIKCIKDLKSFCNGSEKSIFIKDKIYEVKNSFDNPCIEIRENGEGYTFFDNSKDSYFVIIGICENLIITKDNISLYYEFMSDDDKETHKRILKNLFYQRYVSVFDVLNIVRSYNNEAKCKYKYIPNQKYLGYSLFDIKDTLKPIDEYIKEIKESELYKNYIFTKRIYKLENRLLEVLGFKGLQPKNLKNKIFKNRDYGWKIVKKFNEKGNSIVGLTVFGIEDKLEPIEKYVNEITSSKEFIVFKRENKFN